MDNTPLVLGGREILPNTRCSLELPLPGLYTHAPMGLPLRVVRGRQAGPCLLVCAALHGDELNGVEIIRRLLALPLLKRLRGTLIAVPVVNVYGLVAHSRYLPDRRDLNRAFPGSESGSLTARLARVFFNEVLIHASHIIDLHTAAVHRHNLPHLRTDISHAQNLHLARVFGAPVILASQGPEGSLRQAARQAGIPLLLYEAGEALRFDELSIRAGVRGILRVMRALEMLPTGREVVPSPALIALNSSWVRATQSGLLREVCPLGARVEREQPLAVISDPFSDGPDSTVLARHAGIVIGHSQLPLVTEGEALFHIARVEGAESAQEGYQDALADLRQLNDPFIPELDPELSERSSIES